MIAVVGKYDPGWFSIRTELAQWRDTLRAFAVNKLVMVPKLKEKEWNGCPKFKQANSIPEALSLFDENIPRVFVEPKFLDKGGISLKDFKHPESAIYIFGNNSAGNKAMIKPGDTVVSIDTPTLSEP